MTTVEDRLDERSVGRLNALADGVFAIAMTLLVLDIRLPDLDDPTDRQLRDALGHLWPRYVSFLISFYVIASFWRRHHREVRAVRRLTRPLISSTLFLLLVVSVTPFVTSVLGSYGTRDGFALLLYCVLNALGLIALLRMRGEAHDADLYVEGVRAPRPFEMLTDLLALLISAGMGYVVPRYGALVLVGLLAVSGVAGRELTRREQRAHPELAVFSESVR